MEKIRAIFMDIDNTLLDFDSCAKQSMEKAAEDLGIKFPEDIFHIFKSTNDALWIQMENGKIKQSDIYEVRWDTIFGKIGICFDGKTFEKQFQLYLRKSAIPERMVLETLEYLSRKYKIYAATNGPYEQQKKRLYDAGLYSYISEVFASGKCGFSKPSREFFEYCFQSLDLPLDKSEVVMIGDSVSADMKGAGEYGLQTIWYNRYKVKENKNYEGMEIENLLDIKKYL